jgi:hypothetical protein
MQWSDDTVERANQVGRSCHAMPYHVTCSMMQCVYVCVCVLLESCLSYIRDVVVAWGSAEFIMGSSVGQDSII